MKLKLERLPYSASIVRGDGNYKIALKSNGRIAGLGPVSMRVAGRMALR